MLKSFRGNNIKHHISGLLLYNKETFMQILEGDRKLVNQLYKNIQRDKRHRYPEVLHEAPILKRNFPDWSMGFANTGGLESIPGFNTLMEDGLAAITTNKNISIGSYIFMNLCTCYYFDEHGDMQQASLTGGWS